MDKVIRDVLAHHGRLADDPATINTHADLYLNGLTSHASVNVMLALEEAFDVEFPDHLLRKGTFQSIDAIADALKTLGCGSEA